MNLFLISLFLLISTVVGLNSPKVHEDSMEYDRSMKLPIASHHIRVYHPPIFNYQATVQQDLLKSRYAQQQQLNFAKLAQIMSQNHRRTLEENSRESRQNINEDNTLNDKETSSSRIRRSRKLEDKNTQNTTKKEVTDRQDYHPRLVYVPNILRQNFGLDSKTAEQILRNSPEPDKDIVALKDLLGKNPNVQLEGLKKLLRSPEVIVTLQTPKPFHPKDHKPIQEKSHDIPNTQSKPNIKVNYLSAEEQEPISSNKVDVPVTLAKPHFEALQAQLDVSSQAEAEKALQHAAKQALAHVEAQHKAIALARFQAQKAALAQVALQNNQFSTPSPKLIAIPTPHYLHQALAQEKQPVYNAHHATYAAPLQEVVVTPQSAKIPVQHIQYVRRPAQAQVNHIKASHAQFHESSNDEHDSFDYASKYAFGYRIKDEKMGNDFGHEERREGKSAKGHYHVLLPDGRLQKVDYYVDDEGYHAKVTYETVGHHK